MIALPTYGSCRLRGHRRTSLRGVLKNVAVSARMCAATVDEFGDGVSSQLGNIRGPRTLRNSLIQVHLDIAG